MLRGTIRDHVTLKRRPFLRFFACEQDLSHEPPDAPLPDAVATGARAVSGRRGDCGGLAGEQNVRRLALVRLSPAVVTPTMKFPHCLLEFHGV